MSWNNYDEKHASALAGHDIQDGDALGATMHATKSPPKARSPESDKRDISPDLSNSPLDRDFIVSPFGSVDLGKGERRVG